MEGQIDFGYYCGDCMDYLPQYPDGYFDLAVVDPPYGINAPGMSMGSNKSRAGDGYPGISVAERLRKERDNTMGCSWDVERPGPEYFAELFRVSKNQVIWGYNYFSDLLPPCRGIIVWDKRQPWDNFSQAEIAWTSYDRPAALVSLSNTGGANAERKIHSTQKPVALYAWIYARYTQRGMCVLDTHVGSASSLIAAHDAGLRYVGFERDKEYYRTSKERLGAHIAQHNLFADYPGVVP